jgi:hypothetical protein
MDQFYYGLRQFADTSNKYFETLKAFTEKADTSSYATEVLLARRLMAYHDSFTPANYDSLINDKDIPDYYKVLIYTRGLKQFAERCQPSVIYGIYQASLKNYSSAIQFLDEVDSCQMDPGMQEFATLVYGYSLFHVDKAKALGYLQKLYASSNSFYRHSAKYFSIPILIEQKRSEEARKLMMEVSIDPEKTKYGYLLQMQSDMK